MRRPLVPLLLPRPSRLAAIGRRPARGVLALLGVLLIVVLLLPIPDVTPDLPRQAGFHTAIADRIRHGGEDYYTAAAAALRGSELPLQPVVAFPLPATAIVVATVPGFLLAAMLTALVGGVAMLWSGQFAPSRAGRIVAVALVLVGAVSAGWTTMAAMPPLWAGLFVALSLGLRRPGRWVESGLIGLAAALIDVAALPYLVVMAVLAWRDRARTEAAGWLAGSVVAAIVLAIHVVATNAAISADAVVASHDPAGPMAAMGALAAADGFGVLPAALAAIAVLAGVAGWAAWRDSIATRALAVVVIGLVLATIAPVASGSAVLLLAPLSLLGLLPAIEGVRDLVAASLDSRRITVTRMVR